MKQDMDMQASQQALRKAIRQNYVPSISSRIKEVIIAIAVFPFQFILVVLMILMSPFIIIANKYGRKG